MAHHRHNWPRGSRRRYWTGHWESVAVEAARVTESEQITEALTADPDWYDDWEECFYDECRGWPYFPDPDEMPPGTSFVPEIGVG